MKYALSVEVKLVEVPDDEPEVSVRLGDDPMVGVAGMMGAATKLLGAGVRGHAFNYGAGAGFDFRKSTEISVSNYAGLAAIIGRFDNLMSDIEAEKLLAKGRTK